MFNQVQTRYIGKIINNNDPDQNGKVKIFVDFLMFGWSEDHYPWASQYKDGTGGSTTQGKSEIPENNSLVWVWHEKTNFKNWFYGSDVHLEDLNPHTLFYDHVKSAIESNATYPNAKYSYYKNRICLGVDSSSNNPEIYMYHPSGTFILIDKDGKINIDSSAVVKVKQGGSELKLDDGTTTIKGDLKVEDGGLTVDNDIVWLNGSTPTHGSTHEHLVTVPGNPSGSTIAGT